MSPGLVAKLAQRAGRPDPDLRDIVVAISQIPYGRPEPRTSKGVVDCWRGTCSTKHVLLRDVVATSWPEMAVEVWHRPFVVTRELARSSWGEDVAAVVPEAGLMDVHTFATIDVGGRSVVVDVTFAIEDWDGTTDVPLACGDGTDHPAGDDPMATKADLVAQWCDPNVREPFISALSI